MTARLIVLLRCFDLSDLGYLFNGAMFARNGRAGYVLKPAPLRIKAKEESFGRVKHQLKVRVISAQQLPTPSDFLKRDSMIDPFVEVTVFTPSLIPPPSSSSSLQPPSEFPPSQPSTVSKPTIKLRTRTVEDNGFNPAWNETLSFDFEGAEGMEDLVFVRFDVRYEGEVVDMFDKSVGSYCVPLGALNMGQSIKRSHRRQKTDSRNGPFASLPVICQATAIFRCRISI